MDFLTKKEKIDYHIHTPYSDGNKNVLELLEIAQREKVKEIAFTDHDNIEVYDYLKKIKNSNCFTGKIIVGCELAVEFDGYRIEILAYNFDLKKAKKYEYVQRKIRFKKFKTLLNILVQKAKFLGFKLGKKILIDKKYPLVCESLLNEMKKFPENKLLIEKYKLDSKNHSKVPAFFSRVMNDKNFAFYINPLVCLPSIEKASNFFKKIGGVVVLAHPHKTSNIDGVLFGVDLVKSLFNKGVIDGVEIAHSSNKNIEEIKKLNEFCVANKLVRTFGSDYHGNSSFDGNKCSIGLLTEMQKTSTQIKKLI